jgi:hypothetical protein
MRCIVGPLCAIVLVGCASKHGTSPEPSLTGAAGGSAVPATPPQHAPSKSQDAQAEAKVLKPFDGVTVFLDEEKGSRVEVAARVCLDEGFLEQVACAPRSREHESLVVVMPARPNQVHAALLMAGFKPGKPGQWLYEDNKIQTVNPTGDALDIWVRYADATGKTVEHPIRQWIRGAVRITEENQPPPKHPEFPAIPWIFGGSAVEPNPPFMDPGEHYVADMTGSIVGLVTFGDETIGLSKVLSDQEEVQAPVWEINSDTVPPLDTNVTLILKKWQAD